MSSYRVWQLPDGYMESKGEMEFRKNYLGEIELDHPVDPLDIHNLLKSHKDHWLWSELVVDDSRIDWNPEEINGNIIIYGDYLNEWEDVDQSYFFLLPVSMKRTETIDQMDEFLKHDYWN